MSSPFLGNNRQHILVYAKVISSWVRMVLIIADAHISPGTHQGAVACTALVASVYLVSILRSR